MAEATLCQPALRVEEASHIFTFLLGTLSLPHEQAQASLLDDKRHMVQGSSYPDTPQVAPTGSQQMPTSRAAQLSPVPTPITEL